ncbi:hypothetical protein ACROYT_G024232 [Oculina patagonica]
MKFTVVILVFVAFRSAVGVDSESARESSNKITGHRSPITSGDTIALRSAYSSGVNSKKWLACTKASCSWTNCQGAAIDSKGWSSCDKRMMFIITAKGKKEGHTINSGDKVLLSSVNYGPRYRLSCSNSTSAPCCAKTPTRSIKKGDWLEDSDATFHIFSYDAVDGTPVENRDVVGFKYPYSSNSAWLTFSGRHFYPRRCSSKSKEPCAAENKPTGFVIFKKL